MYVFRRLEKSFVFILILALVVTFSFVGSFGFFSDVATVHHALAAGDGGDGDGGGDGGDGGADGADGGIGPGDDGGDSGGSSSDDGGADGADGGIGPGDDGGGQGNAGSAPGGNDDGAEDADEDEAVDDPNADDTDASIAPGGVTGAPGTPGSDTGGFNAVAIGLDMALAALGFALGPVGIGIGLAAAAFGIATGTSVGEAAAGTGPGSSALGPGAIGDAIGAIGAAVGIGGGNETGVAAGDSVGSEGDESRQGQEGFFPIASFAPIISFSVSNDVVKEGASIELSWRVEHALRCEALDSWTGEKPLKGTEQLGNLTKNGVYTLSCRGDRNTTRTRTKFITVIPDIAGEVPTFERFETISDTTFSEEEKETLFDRFTGALANPFIELTAQPSPVEHGQPVTLSWRAPNTAACIGGDDWPRSQANVTPEQKYLAPVGTRTVFFNTNAKQFTLMCLTVDGRQVQESILIDVLPPRPPAQRAQEDFDDSTTAE